MNDQRHMPSPSAGVAPNDKAQSGHNYRRLHSVQAKGASSESVSEPTLWALEHIKARRRRDQYFTSSLFKEPAWDILLELFVAHAEDRPVRVADACRVTATSASTGLRWIGTLEAARLIEREPDTSDGRASFVHLSSIGLQIMTDYLDDVAHTRRKVAHD